MAENRVVIENVPVEEYLRYYAEQFYEWVDGTAYKFPTVTLTHQDIWAYLRTLLNVYVDLNPIGDVFRAAFIMWLDSTRTIREPDLQVIIGDNLKNLTEEGMIGPADICIEIVAPESVVLDHGIKFAEYEQAGVREYWIIDPIHKEGRFYQLNEEKVYSPVKTDEQGYYQTPLLPRFKLHVPTLWESPIPNTLQAVQEVQAMLKEES